MICLRWRLFSSVVILIIILSVIKAFAQPKTYQATLKLLLEPDFISVPTADLPIGGERKRPYVPPEFRDYRTILEVIRSREVLAPALLEIAAAYPKEDYRILSAKLTARHIAGSELIEINFRDIEPDKVEFILEKLAEAYIEYAQKASLKGVNQAFDLVQEQLPIARNEVDRLQQELQNFRQDNGFYSPDQQSDNLYGQLNSLIARSRDIDASLNSTTALFQELSNRVRVTPEISDSSSATLYLFLLENLESGASNNSSLVGQALTEIEGTDALNSSEVVKLDNALKLLQTKNNIVTISEQKVTLEQEIQRLNEEVKAFALLDRKYADIQRQLDISVASLNRLLAAEEELRIEISRQIPPWEIITGTDTGALPITSIPKILFLGFLAALFAGVGATLIANQIDDNYTSVENIRDDFIYPVVGIIPFKPENKSADCCGIKSQMTKSRDDFGFHEAFELLNVNLRLLDPDGNLDSIVVSSAIPGEGKSTIAQSLASSIHRSGKRVLLIDADLRRPSLGLRSSCDAHIRGLSDLLISEKEEIFSFINTVPGDADIMLSGTAPPDAVKIFSSEKFSTVLEELKQRYDLIIFDAPPALGLGDTRLLSHKTNGLLLVINTGTRKQNIKRLTHELAQLKSSVLGVVINNSLNKANFYDHACVVYEYYKPSQVN